jgi:hypothetical protein
MFYEISKKIHDMFTQFLAISTTLRPTNTIILQLSLASAVDVAPIAVRESHRSVMRECWRVHGRLASTRVRLCTCGSARRRHMRGWYVCALRCVKAITISHIRVRYHHAIETSFYWRVPDFEIYAKLFGLFFIDPTQNNILYNQLMKHE